MLAVLRIKGRVEVREGIRDTMEILGLGKKHSLIFIEQTPSNLGMLKKSKDYLTWGEASEKTIEMLKEKKGAKDVYHLAPPRKGFKSLKQRWPRGDLGYRGDKINELIERML